MSHNPLWHRIRSFVAKSYMDSRAAGQAEVVAGKPRPSTGEPSLDTISWIIIFV